MSRATSWQRLPLVGALLISAWIGAGCAASDTSRAKLADPVQVAADLQGIAVLSAAEILAFDPSQPAIFVTTAVGVSRIDVVAENGRLAMSEPWPVPIGIERGEEVTSVAIDPSGRGFAAAAVVPPESSVNPGRVVLFHTKTGQELASVSTGYHPDCVIFSPDGKWLITADEGEGSGPVDRAGGITLLSLAGMTADGLSESLTLRTITVEDDPSAEPEYLAANAEGVWVAFQESSEFRRHTFGDTEAWSTRAILDPREILVDANDRDGVISPTDRVLGLPQPDTIALIPTRRGSVLVAANEGDPREGEEVRASQLDADSSTPRLEVGGVEGQPSYKAAFGTRDLSIHDATTGELIATTGTQIEEALRDLAARRVARGFANAEADLDDRSDKRGPEPEGLATIMISGRSLVFVGLERADAVVVFDLSNPARPQRVGLIDLNEPAIPGDAPEGLLAFTQAGQSYLAVASEGSGTVHVYRVAVETVGR